MPYLFDTLRTSDIVADMHYRASDPGPGDLFPEFDLPTLEGTRITGADLAGTPAVVVFGSQTCPVTRSALPPLNELHATYGDRVRFVLVQTREAHPGEHLPQPQTPDAKARHATELRNSFGVGYEVAVDDVDGTLHRAVGPKPNSAYVLRPDGTIAARIHWANDTAALRGAIEHVLGGAAPRRGRMMGPLMRAVGHLPDVVWHAGPRAEREVWAAAAPLALLGRLSRLFRTLPQERRGPAAATALAVTVIAVGTLLALALR